MRLVQCIILCVVVFSWIIACVAAGKADDPRVVTRDYAGVEIPLCL